jgi:hypothetical protein
LRVSWVWPNAFLTIVPDMKEFHVYAGTRTLQNTTAPSGTATYRIQAMDPAGNVGPFNMPRPVP